MTSVYMDANAKTYNAVRMLKIKSFMFANNKISNLKETYDKVITVFNYLPVDKTNNHLWAKMVQSAQVARDEHEQEDDICKRSKAPKDLFVDGEQRTYQDFMACLANFCVKLSTIFVNAEQSII